MFMLSLTRKLFGRTTRPCSTSRRKRPHLEVLEDRSVPSTLYVNELATRGSDNGSSWTNAYTSLQSALGAAQSGDQVWVAEGTYKPTSGIDRTVSFTIPDGVAVYGGFAGTETQLGQRNVVQNPTILSGDIGTPGDNSDNSYHVVTTGSDGASTILDGFTITAGNANGDSSQDQHFGGGLYNDNGSPTLTNLTFSGNSATVGGGGLYNFTGSPTLTNVTFSGNSASYDGGGLYSEYGSATLTNVTFSGNSATEGGGLASGGSPRLTNVTFSGNSASYGGGLYSSSGSPTLTNVTFSADSASYYGGGLYNPGGRATLTNCILWGDRGGEMYNGPGSTAVSYSDVQGGYSGTGNINADPLFVNAAAGDLHLKAGSPCIDAGTNSGAPAFDLDGTPRPIDGKGTGTAITDLGAFEYKPAPTFTALSAPTITYGTATTTLTGHLANGNSLVPTGETVSVTINSTTQTTTLDRSGNFSLAFNTATLGVSASPYSVTYSYAGDSTFRSASDSSTTLTVNPAALTITAGDATKITGEANPTFAASYQGFVNGEDATVLSGTLTFTTQATTNSPAGTYAITPSGLTSSNYAITFVGGRLTVISYGQATTNLQALVDGAGLDHGLQTSLDSQLQAALACFTTKDMADGASQLDAFINHVSAQRGKKINAALADRFIAAAQQIINAVG
jgi:predicted outer membrane repeat protein